MGLAGILGSFGKSGLALLVAGAMACGDSGNSSSSEQKQGCITNNDCHGGRVCENGRCLAGPPSSEVVSAPLFCCGKVIYSPDGNSLSSLDVSLLESSSFDINSDPKPGYFADLRATSDFQRAVVSTHYGNGSPAPFYVFDVNGNTFSPFSYIPRGNQHSALGTYSLPHAQLLSDGVTIITVLGDDFDGGEGELAIPRSQLYRIRENEIPQPLTSVTDGVRYVQGHVVFPDDTIYFFGYAPQDERHLFRTDARGSRVDIIPSSSELPLGVESMYRLASGQILVKSFTKENNIYLVEPTTGTWRELGIDSVGNVLISPRRDQFVYPRKVPDTFVHMSVLYDINSGQELELSRQNFPSCRNTSCFSFESGMWLP